MQSYSSTDTGGIIMTAAVKTSTAWVNIAQTEDRSKTAFVSVSPVKGEWATPIYLNLPSGVDVITMIADILGAEHSLTEVGGKPRVDLVSKATYATTMEIQASELKTATSDTTGNRYKVLDLTDKDRFFRFLSEIMANRTRKGATRPEIGDVLAEFRARHGVVSHQITSKPVVATVITDDDPV
jgi:hypothetical protein